MGGPKGSDRFRVPRIVNRRNRVGEERLAIDLLERLADDASECETRCRIRATARPVIKEHQFAPGPRVLPVAIHHRSDYVDVASGGLFELWNECLELVMFRSRAQ